jgi:hypothetical protein
MLAGFKEKSISAVTELTMELWFMTTHLSINLIDNVLGRGVSWSKNFHL